MKNIELLIQKYEVQSVRFCPKKKLNADWTWKKDIRRKFKLSKLSHVEIDKSRWEHRIYWGMYCLTDEEVLAYFTKTKVVIEDKVIYEKPHIIVGFKNGSKEVVYYDTNEELEKVKGIILQYININDHILISTNE